MEGEERQPTMKQREMYTALLNARCGECSHTGLKEMRIYNDTNRVLYFTIFSAIIIMSLLGAINDFGLLYYACVVAIAIKEAKNIVAAFYGRPRLVCMNPHCGHIMGERK